MDEEKNVNPGADTDPLTKNGSKKRKNRYSYLDDIHRTADGKYIYTGPCFAYDEETNKRGAVLLRLWLFAFPAFAACVASGCFYSPFMRQGAWYTLAPFAFELLFVCLELWAVIRITCNGRILREYVRKQTFGSFPLRCWLAAISAGVGLIAASVYMIAKGTEGHTAACIVYLVLRAVVIAGSILTEQYADAVEWKETQEKV